MRIAEFTAYHVRIPLKKTIRHASHVRRETESLVMCCRLSDGTTGWGEGLPRPYVTGETMETVWQQVQQTPLARFFDTKMADLAAAVSLCRSFVPAVPQPVSDEVARYVERGCFGNAFRCAVELSVLDAVARAEGQPLSAVTRLLPESAGLYQPRDEVQYSAALTAASPFRERLRSWMFRLYGFHQLKVKVGVKGRDDAATLQRVRRIVGPQMDIRLDANEAWHCAELEEKLQPLLPFGISSVEQPVPHAEADLLAAVRPRLPVPLMLDESLCSLDDARHAIERGSCDLFNIRLSKCGGFLSALQLAAMAHDAGLGYQLGCQVGETGILSAAGRHFACSVKGIRYLEGSYDRHLVRERLIREEITFGRGGRAPALQEPGLSVTLDSEALQRVTLARHVISLR